MADLSTDARGQAADKGQALPDGSYPIRSIAELRKAIQAFGRASDKAKARAHIIKRAKALKATHLLPSAWHISEARERAVATHLGEIREAGAYSEGRHPRDRLGRWRVVPHALGGFKVEDSHTGSQLGGHGATYGDHLAAQHAADRMNQREPRRPSDSHPWMTPGQAKAHDVMVAADRRDRPLPAVTREERQREMAASFGRPDLGRTPEQRRLDRADARAVQRRQGLGQDEARRTVQHEEMRAHQRTLRAGRSIAANLRTLGFAEGTADVFDRGTWNAGDRHDAGVAVRNAKEAVRLKILPAIAAAGEGQKQGEINRAKAAIKAIEQALQTLKVGGTHGPRRRI